MGTRGSSSFQLSAWSRHEAGAQDVQEGFHGQFDKEKRLGDEIVAAAHGGAGAAFETGESGDEDNGSFFVKWQGPQFGAELKPGHARHINIKEDEVEFVLTDQIEGGFGIFDRTTFEFRAFEGVGQGASRNGFVIDHQNVGRRNFLFVHVGPVLEEDAEEIDGRSGSAQGGSIDVPGFFEQFLEQPFEGI